MHKDNSQQTNQSKPVMNHILLALLAFCFVAAMILFVVGLTQVSNGFDYLEYSAARRVNTHVGGDAYNLIINAGRFAGYLAFGGTMLLGSFIFTVTGLYFSAKLVAAHSGKREPFSPETSDTPQPQISDTPQVSNEPQASDE